MIFAATLNGSHEGISGGALALVVYQKVGPHEKASSRIFPCVLSAKVTKEDAPKFADK